MGDFIRFDVSEFLDDEESIVEYLKLAIADNDPKEYVRALEAVAKARYMTELSQKTGIPRATLYRVMNDGEIPSWQDVDKISSALGIVLPERQVSVASM